MNDFLANVDRGAECLKRNSDDIDGTNDTRTEAPRLQKKDAFRWVRGVGFAQGGGV
jgi:hypothetical protein